jgi:hypothetical protein
VTNLARPAERVLLSSTVARAGLHRCSAGAMLTTALKTHR